MQADIRVSPSTSFLDGSMHEEHNDYFITSICPYYSRTWRPNLAIIILLYFKVAIGQMLVT